MKICISCLLLLFVLTLNSVESQLNRIEAQEMLDLHNEFRRFVRPSASNMLEMRWNRTLALIAQEYANKCLFVHNNQRTSQVNGEFDYVGENLYISWGMPNPHSSAVESWNEEKKDYVYGTGCIPQKVCGHYTQVIWWNSEYVGCGQATCSAVPGISSCKAENPCTLVVCNYGPG